MHNFTFLQTKEHFSDFADACLDAEKSFAVSYGTAAVNIRRAFELAVKWVYAHEAALSLPYQETLSSLLHEDSFRELLEEPKLFKGLQYIKDLGNKAAHTSKPVKQEEAVYALRWLYEFIGWIDCCYSKEGCHRLSFDETLLSTGQEKEKTQKELNELSLQLGAKDRKLEEIIKENEELSKQFAAIKEENRKNRDYKVEELDESETRNLYINLQLELAGWQIGKDCIEEEQVWGMPNSSGTGYVDYVLYGDGGKPLALIEAKRTSVDPKTGKNQAKLYADCLEKKHGRRPILFYTDGFEYNLWDDLSYPARQVSGIYTKADLEWLLFKRKHKQSLATITINDAITDRPYQKIAIRAVCETYARAHRKALLVMATGSGKTRTAISLVDVLLQKGWVKHILFLADRRKLVSQAKNNFSTLLPELSLCNLLDSKDAPESKMVFSTYPTMMNAIDETKSSDGSRLFTPGHFDLIIIDESHRSIYKKYGTIFDYFDAALLGLTATPKDEIDKNTYSIFELESGVPTYAYELAEAVEQKYLVPYHTIETRLKLPEEGICYDQLSEEEKEHFEDTFDDDVEQITGDDINSFLFNNDTVDTVIIDLMEKGLKIEGGDKLGKTIVFAKNKKHAEFFIERFNIWYPEYKDQFAKPIYTGIKYVDENMTDFETKEKLPQIAVSVDMLDTGVDIPQVLNLVFFKKVRSKSKFHQMIGRGTRLCPDLFGAGIDKECFRIFDYCANFDFFRESKFVREPGLVKSLSENLFNARVDLVKELQRTDYQEDEYIKHRESLITDLTGEIDKIDQNKYRVRMKIKYIHKFQNRQEWTALSGKTKHELTDHIAPLVVPVTGNELAKRFDYLMFCIEYALLTGKQAAKLHNRVIKTAAGLGEKASIAQVTKQKALIEQVQTDEYWQTATLFDHEAVRLGLRDLIRFIEKEPKKLYYTNFRDEVLSVKEAGPEYSVNDLHDYRKKVNHYLKTHTNDYVVYKLRNNKKMTHADIKHLEKILWNDLGSKEDYKKEFGDEKLLHLASRLTGLDQNAANEAFSEFLSDHSLNKNQMEFVKLIVTYVVNNGILDKNVLNEQPFNQYGSIAALFSDKMHVARELIAQIEKLNERVNVA